MSERAGPQTRSTSARRSDSCPASGTMRERPDRCTPPATPSVSAKRRPRAASPAGPVARATTSSAASVSWRRRLAASADAASVA